MELVCKLNKQTNKQTNGTKPLNWVVLVHAFNPSIQEAETFTAQSWKLAWCTERVPGQSKLHRETLSLKKKKKKKKERKEKRKN